MTLLDVGAIHAPLTWIDPNAVPEATAWLPTGALLCCGAEEAILIDCGIGPFAAGFERPIREVSLVAAIEAAGCTVAGISTVVLTHVDDDHSGGLVARDAAGHLYPAFPGARVVMLEAATELLDGRAPERYDLAEEIGAALRGHGIEPIGLADGAEIVDGMRLRSTPGHRYGHASVELTGRDARLVHLADVIHAAEHVAHPEWDFLHDSEPDVALHTRREAIASLAGSGALVACSHVDRFGRIQRSPDGPVWVDA